MAELLAVISILACIAVMLFGRHLLLKGREPGQTMFKALGTGVQGPFSGVLILAGVLGIVAGVPYFYSQNSDKASRDLTARVGALQDDNKTKDEQITELEGQLRGEQDKNRMLEGEKHDLSLRLKSETVAHQKTKADLDDKTREAEGLSGDLQRERERSHHLVAENGGLKQSLRDTEKRLLNAVDDLDRVWQLADRLSLSEAGRAALEQLQDKVLDLNGELTFVRVRKAAWPKIVGQAAVATFEIYDKDLGGDLASLRGIGLFDFGSQQYRVSGDSAGRLSAELAERIGQEICQSIQRAIAGEVPLVQVVKQIPELSKYDGDPVMLMKIGELWYVATRLKAMVARTRIMVRGYADGEQAGWERPLDASRRRVELHPNAFPSSDFREDYALTFKAGVETVDLGRPSSNRATYGNADLPNLRAAEVDAILKALTLACPSQGVDGPLSAEILEGRVYREHGPADRKARVHFALELPSD